MALCKCYYLLTYLVTKSGLMLIVSFQDVTLKLGWRTGAIITELEVHLAFIGKVGCYV